jgi:hypothetical protein
MSEGVATVQLVDEELGQTPPGVDLVWEQSESRLKAQLQQANALDTKAGVLVGIHALAAGLLGSVAGRLSGASRGVGIGVVVGLLLSGWLSLQAFRAQEYNRNPSPEELWRFAGWSEGQIRYRFVSTRFEAIEENRRKLRRKARLLTWSIGLLGVLASSVGIATILSLAT